MLDILTATQWIGVAIIAILLVFAGFAFRQGMKVKPEKDVRPTGAVTDVLQNLFPKSRAIARRQLPRQAILSSSLSCPSVLLQNLAGHKKMFL
jgi:hypothetical protein